MLDRMRDRLVRYNALPGINKSQFRAQMYEEELVTLARDLAFSAEIAHALRLECIKFVVQTARGVPAPWFNAGETIDPEVRSLAGGTVGETIDAARSASEMYQRLDDLVRRKVPFRDWPADIRGMAEAEAFSEMDGDETLVGITLDTAV